MTAVPVVTTPRRHDLDALRAVAMLLGIALHGALSFVEFPWAVQDTQQHQGFGLFFYAVHGFRMPLFFVLSGFFTAMLWRARGPGPLIRHRFRRIFLPCVAGVLTVVPLVIVAGIIATELQGGSKDIYTAAREGDKDAIQLYLDQGQDINGQDAKWGVTPISWAALQGSTETVAFLLEKGARVQATCRDGSTALHSAAFLGRTSTAQLLLKKGGDPTLRDAKGSTPIDLLRVDWTITRDIARLLNVKIEKEAVEQGRREIAEIFKKETASLPIPKPDRPQKPVPQPTKKKGLLVELMYVPIFHHLWFLWFLCWLVAIFVLVAWAVDRLGWKSPPTWLILSPMVVLWLIPLTMVPQSWMGMGGYADSFGPDTSVGLLPVPHILGYYAIFFFFGALYYNCDDTTGKLGQWWYLTLPIGLFILFPVGLELSTGIFGLREKMVKPDLYRPLSVLFQVLYTWTMTFALMGLFRKLFSRESKAMRYLSSSSYWLYLAHLPLIIIAQAMVRELPLPAIVKFILVCGSVTLLLLWTYQTFVRYTPVGTFLNGPRARPKKQSKAQPPPTGPEASLA